jgi:hypothetical protein
MALDYESDPTAHVLLKFETLLSQESSSLISPCLPLPTLLWTTITDLTEVLAIH